MELKSAISSSIDGSVPEAAGVNTDSLVGQRHGGSLHALDAVQLLAQLIAFAGHAVELGASGGERTHAFLATVAERLQARLLIRDHGLRFGQRRREAFDGGFRVAHRGLAVASAG